jgi:hypothetical protein
MTRPANFENIFQWVLKTPTTIIQMIFQWLGEFIHLVIFKLNVLIRPIPIVYDGLKAEFIHLLVVDRAIYS